MSTSLSIVVAAVDPELEQDDAALLESTIASLSPTPPDSEVLLVAAGDPAGSLSERFAARCGARAVGAAAPGLTAALNAGLAEARGRYVCFLLPGIALPDRFVATVSERIGGDDAPAFLACPSSLAGSPALAADMETQSEPIGLPALLARNALGWGSLIRRETLLGIGGFDGTPALRGVELWSAAISLLATGGSAGTLSELDGAPSAPPMGGAGTREPDARAFAALVNRHAELYGTHWTAVFELLQAQVERLEAGLGSETPPRPRMNRDWQATLLGLDGHRRRLEQERRRREADEPVTTPTLGDVVGHLDHAACDLISGWAWIPAAPEQRLRLDVWRGSERVGTVWAREFRQDLEDAGIGQGHVGFRFRPPRHLGRDPEDRIAVTVAGTGEELIGSPRLVRCRCGEPGIVPVGLRGLSVRGERGSAESGGFRLEGWVVGDDAPVEAIELRHDGRAFSRTVPELPSPEAAEAFADLEWAASGGFAADLSLAAVTEAGELEVRAVLADGGWLTLARLDLPLGRFPAPGVAVILDPAAGEPADAVARFGQTVAPGEAYIRSETLPGHPGFHSTGEWNIAGPGAELVWLSSGGDEAECDFLERAASALQEQPHAAFVCATSGVRSPGARSLRSALAATDLGTTVAFRAAAVRAVGGFDEHAESAAGAQWDLAIRLAEAGYDWIRLAAARDGAPGLAARAGERTIRWLYGKHSELYERELPALIAERERAIGELLRRNQRAELRLTESVRPRLRLRRRERDRLALRLRAESSGEPLGDFARWTPLGPPGVRNRGEGVLEAYLERFLARHARDLGGHVLAHGSVALVGRHGGSRVTRCDVIDDDPANPQATIVGDLSTPAPVPAATYDCVLLGWWLAELRRPEVALAELARLLRPGGILLAAAPVSATSGAGPRPAGAAVPRWTFSAAGLRRLLEASFPVGELEIDAVGNAASVAAHLVGLTVDELGVEALEAVGCGDPLVVTARAVRSGGAASAG